LDNYARGNDFAMIKNFRPKKFLMKNLVDNYSRGNDNALIKKILTKKNFAEKF